VNRLDIKHEGPIYVITPKNGEACPNWHDGGCSVYDERPRECRLFPFTLFVRQQKSHAVSLGYHCDTRCPLKTELLRSEDEAQAIVSDFGREAFPAMSVEVAKMSRIKCWQRRVLRGAYFIAAQIKEWSRSADDILHAPTLAPVGTNGAKASDHDSTGDAGRSDRCRASGL
jgi:Fe-S-cluster containining protein